MKRERLINLYNTLMWDAYQSDEFLDAVYVYEKNLRRWLNAKVKWSK